jgi:hypothetical protein
MRMRRRPKGIPTPDESPRHWWKRTRKGMRKGWRDDKGTVKRGWRRWHG